MQDIQQVRTTAPPRRVTSLWTSLALLALAVPLNLAYNLSPSATVLNQAAAWFGWGVLAVLLAVVLGGSGVSLVRAAGTAPGGLRALWAALLLVAAAALVAPWRSGLPWGLASATALTVAAAAALAQLGAAVARSGWHRQAPGGALMRALCLALLVAGTLGALIGIVQVFAPALPDGDWIAAASVGGRASGNLRQPNHLASVLLWAAIAAVWCFESARRARSPGLAEPAVLFAMLFAMLYLLMLLGVVLTASRTGAVGVLLLALWGGFDRRLTRAARVGLLAAPMLYALLWLGVEAATSAGGAVFAGTERLHEADPSSSRLAIWANTLELIARHPWAGVGLGEFNFAWTLDSFSHPRPTAFFDHTHNLPLQLWVELGLPLGTLVLALLAFALWQAWRAAARAPDAAAALAQRCAFMLVLMAALHSQLEYPLWYAHFLFPAALAWGLCLGSPAAAVATPAEPGARVRLGAVPPLGLVPGLALMAGGLTMALDYARVVPIFAPTEPVTPLAQRIAAGQRSLFFAHHADYAQVTTADDPAGVAGAFARPVHYLLDARLMQAWAEALAGSGQVDRARWVAQRLREFGHPQADAFFARCAQPGAPWPFQCEPPERAYTHEDFRRGASSPALRR